MKVYSKLVKDRILEIITKGGNTADFIILSDESFEQAIKDKLIEEVANAQNRDDILSELAHL